MFVLSYKRTQAIFPNPALKKYVALSGRELIQPSITVRSHALVELDVLLHSQQPWLSRA
jgi:hypothetical protein